MSQEEAKLDNPVWYSLAETHQNLAVNYGDLKFYQPEICPFGGFLESEQTFSGLEKYAQLTNDFYVVGKKPVFDDKLRLKKELVCLQMILESPIELEIVEEIRELKTDQEDDLFNLVNLVQPGYFKRQTSQMGNYYGIYKNGELVAVTGERLKMEAYTEISAVVTHPEHTGRGYAKQLIALTVNRNFQVNKIPYLHVAETNLAAINLYQKLGFRTRRKISFWNLVKYDET